MTETGSLDESNSNEWNTSALPPCFLPVRLHASYVLIANQLGRDLSILPARNYLDKDCHANRLLWLQGLPYKRTTRNGREVSMSVRKLASPSTPESGPLSGLARANRGRSPGRVNCGRKAPISHRWSARGSLGTSDEGLVQMRSTHDLIIRS